MCNIYFKVSVLNRNLTETQLNNIISPGIVTSRLHYNRTQFQH